MSSQSIRLMCPNLRCRKILCVPETTRGKSVRCAACTSIVRVPMLGEKELNLKDKPAEENADQDSVEKI